MIGHQNLAPKFQCDTSFLNAAHLTRQPSLSGIRPKRKARKYLTVSEQAHRQMIREILSACFYHGFMDLNQTPDNALEATAALICGWEVASRHNATVAEVSAASPAMAGCLSRVVRPKTL
jgi:hypothetical protein